MRTFCPVPACGGFRCAVLGDRTRGGCGNVVVERATVVYNGYQTGQPGFAGARYTASGWRLTGGKNAELQFKKGCGGPHMFSGGLGGADGGLCVLLHAEDGVS